MTIDTNRNKHKRTTHKQTIQTNKANITIDTNKNKHKESPQMPKY